MTENNLLPTLFVEEMRAVDALTAKRLNSEVELISEVAAYLINAKGKRLRSMITLAAAALCEYRGNDHIKLACAVELMHTATLLHDDVVDESEQRRGNKTARKVWGNPTSVLVGDFLLGQAFQLMVEAKSLDALDVLSKAAAVISEGEVMQLTTAKNITTSRDDYLRVITNKTATLFAAAAEIGAILADYCSGQRLALNNYGLNLGVSFQLIDDVLDYSGQIDLLGKSVGDDFREGKVTLPVILAHDRAGSNERRFWRKTIVDGQIEDGDFQTALDYLHKYEALADSVTLARSYGELAAKALASFPSSSYKSAMIWAIDFAISRVS